MVRMRALEVVEPELERQAVTVLNYYGMLPFTVVVSNQEAAGGL
jgi:hypothetical protein